MNLGNYGSGYTEIHTSAEEETFSMKNLSDLTLESMILNLRMAVMKDTDLGITLYTI